MSDTKCYYILLVFLHFVQTVVSLNPVILVPGDGGSQIQARLDKPAVVHYLCAKKAEYYSLWLNLEQLAPVEIDCFVDNMRLVYNRTTHKTSNSPGVITRIPNFGHSKSVEWLDPDSEYSSTSYFAPIVDSLVGIGYVRGKSVRGAPYDFRRAPNEFKDFYTKFKKLIEETYTINNNSKVVLIAHSMGNPTTLYFLNHQDQAWKDKYISKFITLAGVWGGSVKTLRLFTSGDSLGVPFVSAIKVRKEQRSMPSTAWLMPSSKFWNKSEILVSRPGKNYTVFDYKEFFADIGFMDGFEMRKDTENLIMDVKAPGVEIHCLHGYNISTPGAFRFDNDKYKWPDNQPFQVNDDGDGTVNMRSLLGCLKWQAEQKQTVNHEIFKNAEHMQILQNPDIIAYIKKHVSIP